MKVYNNAKTSEWDELCKRPLFQNETLTKSVSEIIEQVRINGDQALREYALKFDGVEINTIEVSKAEYATAEKQVSSDLKAAIQLAYDNIYKFHEAQKSIEEVIETSPGVQCWRKSLPIEKVGLYIPGGSAPLFSSILMLGIPAKIAGCKEIVLCTPPRKNGTIHPAILYTAQLVGIQKVFKSGGAQAISALAYGTNTISKVYKIFGPGNQYVTKAKELVQQQGVAIDMPAGPSEVLVIADETCTPTFVAADLLSQAEHGDDSQVILLSNSSRVIDECLKEVEKQVESLPRKTIAKKALDNSKGILFNDLNTCFQFSNQYAPEHLIIASENAQTFVDQIKTAGSVFLGNYSCESAGDYASGTNHTLPTNGFARNYSGVSLDSFVNKVTFQKVNKEGIQNIGKAIELMAEAEGLIAHKNAVSLRLKAISND